MAGASPCVQPGLLQSRPGSALESLTCQAHGAGRAGDVVLQINGVPERLPEDLRQHLLEQARGAEAGKGVTVDGSDKV